MQLKIAIQLHFMSADIRRGERSPARAHWHERGLLGASRRLGKLTNRTPDPELHLSPFMPNLAERQEPFGSKRGMQEQS